MASFECIENFAELNLYIEQEKPKIVIFGVYDTILMPVSPLLSRYNYKQNQEFLQRVGASRVEEIDSKAKYCLTDANIANVIKSLHEKNILTVGFVFLDDDTMEFKDLTFDRLRNVGVDFSCGTLFGASRFDRVQSLLQNVTEKILYFDHKYENLDRIRCASERSFGVAFESPFREPVSKEIFENCVMEWID